MNRSDHLHTPSDTPTFSWRLRLALLVSVAIHALLLSIPLEGDVFGMPGLRLPWQERRLTASDLQVVLAPAPRTVPPTAPLAAPAPELAAPELAPPAPPVTPAAGLTALPPAVTKTEEGSAVSAPRQPVTPAPPAPAAALPTTEAVPVPAPQLDDAQQRQLEAAAASARIIALDKARQDQVIRDERAREEVAARDAAQADAARLAQARLTQQAAEEQQRQADLRREAQRQEQAATEAQVQARELAAREERSRADAAQREAERVDVQRREQLARTEAAQREAARVEADRQAQARQAQLAQQAKLDTARQDAAKQESARQEAAKAEAARQVQLQQEQAGQAKLAQEAQREERLRAIGRQMKQEAAQRDAAAPLPGMPPPMVHGQRRGWLLGRADPNTELVTYAQAMGRKIELNMTFDAVRDAVKQPHRQPVVTVAVRSDGSVERVTFVTSSGVPAIDEAIRQIVASQAPYGPFPPALARLYDVVEIRRTWIFDMAVRLE